MKRKHILIIVGVLVVLIVAYFLANRKKPESSFDPFIDLDPFREGNQKDS